MAGVTPSAKSGWFSGLNNITVCVSVMLVIAVLTAAQVYALHELHSIYAGMLMFTEEDVIRLMELSGVWYIKICLRFKILTPSATSPPWNLTI